MKVRGFLFRATVWILGVTIIVPWQPLMVAAQTAQPTPTQDTTEADLDRGEEGEEPISMPPPEEGGDSGSFSINPNESSLLSLVDLLINVQEDTGLLNKKRLVLHPKDVTGIQNGKADVRLIEALDYLTDPKLDSQGNLVHSPNRGAGHDYIKAQLNEKFDNPDDLMNTDNPNEPYFSANALWQGADVTEIDQLACRLKIQGLISTSTKKLPPTPIKVQWQSDEGLKGESPGLSGKTMRELFEAAGADGFGALFSSSTFAELLKGFKGKSLGDWAMLIGSALIAQELGIPMTADNIFTLLEDGGKVLIGKALGIPPEGLTGSSPEEVFESIGRSAIEQTLQIPFGSLAGEKRDGTISSDSILRSAGRRMMEERVLRVRAGTLKETARSTDEFEILLGRALVEEYAGLRQESLKQGKRNKNEKFDVTTIAFARESVGQERFETGFQLPGSIDTNFGLRVGRTAQWITDGNESGRYLEYFQEIGKKYLERFRNFKNYTYTINDPAAPGAKKEVTENMRDKIENLPDGAFDRVAKGDYDAFRAIGIKVLSETLGQSRDYERYAYGEWLGRGDFAVILDFPPGKPVQERSSVAFGEIEALTNASFDFMGDDLPRIFALNEGASVFRLRGERALLNGIKPLTERELARSKVGGKILPLVEAVQEVSNALNKIDTALDGLDREVAGGDNKEKVRKIRAQRVRIKGAVNSGRVVEAISEMRGLLGDLKRTTTSNNHAQINEVDKEIGEIAQLIQGLSGERPLPRGIGGPWGWVEDNLQLSEKVSLFGVTRREIFQALIGGTANLRDFLIEVGSKKWEREFDLPRNGLKFFLDAVAREGKEKIGTSALLEYEYMPDRPNSKDKIGTAIFLESMGQARLIELHKNPSEYSSEQQRDIGLIVLQTRVSNELARLFGLKGGRYTLTERDVVGIFNGQWQRALIKIGSAQLNLGLEWPEDSEGFLKIIDDPNSEAEPGSNNFQDILTEGFTYRLLRSIGLKHAITLKGNIGHNLGRVSIEDRLGLKHDTFREGIEEILTSNGGKIFAAAFNIPIPADYQRLIEQERAAIEKSYGRGTTAAAQKIAEMENLNIGAFLRFRVLGGPIGPYWDNQSNRDRLKRVDAKLGIDIGSTEALLRKQIETSDYLNRAAKATSFKIAGQVLDQDFHLSEKLGLPPNTIRTIADLLGKDILTDGDRFKLVELAAKAAGINLDGEVNQLLGGSSEKIIWQPGTLQKIFDNPDRLNDILLDQGIRVLMREIGDAPIKLGGVSIDPYFLMRLAFSYYKDWDPNDKKDFPVRGFTDGQLAKLSQDGLGYMIQAALFKLTGGKDVSLEIHGSGNINLRGSGEGIRIPIEYTRLLAQGDTRVLILTGLTFVVKQINYDGSGKTLVPENLRVNFDDIAKAVFGDPITEEVAAFNAVGGVLRNVYPEWDTLTPEEQEILIQEYENTTGNSVSMLKAEARQKVRNELQLYAAYKLLDSVAYRSGLIDIPKNFSYRLFQGNTRDRMEALVEFAGNMLARGDPRLNATVFPDLYHFFFDPVGSELYHNADKLRTSTFSGLATILADEIGWKELPKEFIAAIFYSIQHDWKGEKEYTLDFAGVPITITTFDPKQLQGFAINWAVDGIGQWAKKEWGVDPRAIRQLYEAYIDLQNAQKFLNEAIFEGFVLEVGGDLFLAEAVKSHAYQELQQKKFAAVNLIINIAFSKEFAQIEERNNLPPGTLSQVMTLVVAAIMHVKMDVVGTVMVLIGGIFGDEFASFEEQYNLPRGVTSAAVGVAITSWAASANLVSTAAIATAWYGLILIALFSPFSVKYECQKAPPSRALGEPAYTQALDEFRPGWTNGKNTQLWKRWAQYEVNRIIGELVVDLPQNSGEVNLPTQVETLRREDVASWKAEVDAAYGPLEERGSYYGVGFGGALDRVHIGY